MDSGHSDSYVLLIGAIVLLITQLANYIKAAAAEKIGKQNEKIGKENEGKLDALTLKIDGRLSQLVEEHKRAQRALGITEGQDKERSIQTGHVDLAARVAQQVMAEALEVSIQKLEDERQEALQLKAVAAALAIAKLDQS